MSKENLDVSIINLEAKLKFPGTLKREILRLSEIYYISSGCIESPSLVSGYIEYRLELNFRKDKFSPILFALACTFTADNKNEALYDFSKKLMEITSSRTYLAGTPAIFDKSTIYKATIDTISERFDSVTNSIKERTLSEGVINNSLWLERIKTEIASRGNFTLDIPKFVDVLFKLGVIMSKDDDTSEDDKIPEPPELEDKDDLTF